MTVTGHKVLSEVRSLGGWVLGLALKTVCPINFGLSWGNSWHFVGIMYGREEWVGVGGCLCGPLTTIKEKPCKAHTKVHN